MSVPSPKSRLSFQGKVLIPVIALLVLLPALTVGLIHRSSMEQLHREARQKLNTADAVFKNSLGIRARNLLWVYKTLVKEASFISVAQQGDPPTLSNYLSNILKDPEWDAEVMIFVTEKGQLLAGARRDNALQLEAFEAASQEAITHALQGQPEIAITAIQEQVLNVITVPVFINDFVVGTLAIGVKVGEAAVQELTSLTLGEVALFANGVVSASSLPEGHAREEILRLVRFPKPSTRKQPMVHDVIVGGRHYLAFAAEFPGSLSKASLGYMLLSSYEQELQDLRATQNSLWMLSFFGVMLSTCVVWLAIGKIMEPLRELRNTTEAVGRGDFSKRVHVRSADEVGQLAYAFNQMTANLQSSHEELQKTLETLKSTQAQLVQSEKLSAVGEFVAGIAHELNNPLTSVIGFAELMKQANLEPKHRNFVNCIVKSSERCHKIVQGLLSFARQHPPERKLLRVNEVVGTVLELMAYEMRTSNIEVQTQLEQDLPTIIGDPHQLQQVFLNIVNNARQAIEAHEAHGRIRIVTETHQKTVRILFEDNGPGIQQENLAKVFDPFFTTKPVGKGTGLGLSLCYGIIQEHGGSISAERGVRGGAVFIIELPICEGRPADSNDAMDDGRTSDGSGKRVLVIDDEEWILDLVSQILQGDGYKVDTVNNGNLALDHVTQSEYELLVCDWKMPGLSGPQLYDRLSQVSPESAERLIFMTGDVVNDTFQKFLAKHAKTCLSKPFSVQEFRNAVSKFMASQNN